MRIAVKKMRAIPITSAFCSWFSVKLANQERFLLDRLRDERLERFFRDVPPRVLDFFLAIAQMFPLPLYHARQEIAAL